MKHIYLLIALIFLFSYIFISCDEIPGNIEIINNSKNDEWQTNTIHKIYLNGNTSKNYTTKELFEGESITIENLEPNTYDVLLVHNGFVEGDECINFKIKVEEDKTTRKEVTELWSIENCSIDLSKINNNSELENINSITITNNTTNDFIQTNTIHRAYIDNNWDNNYVSTSILDNEQFTIPKIPKDSKNIVLIHDGFIETECIILDLSKINSEIISITDKWDTCPEEVPQMYVETNTFEDSNIIDVSDIYSDDNIDAISEKNGANVSLKALVVICDSYKTPENNQIVNSVSADKNHTISFLKELEESKVVDVDIQLLNGKNATISNIKSAIKNTQLNKNDVFMFYYSGHGGMTNGKTFLYPSDEDYLFRDELETIVNKKENRFKIILTDACSSSIDSIKSIRAINKAGTIPKNEKEEIYKTLFLKYKGTLSFSAATEGQFAIGADDGGLFTKSLFKEVLSKDPSPSWEMIFEKTKEKTEHKFKDLFNKGVTKGEFENLLLEIIANMFANEVTIDQDTQTPKAYSMPVPIGNEDIENTTSWKTEPDNPPVYNKNIEAKIKNKTKNNIVFYIDRNPKDLDESKWDWTISKKVYIKANETITLKEQPPLRIFYDSSEKGVLEYVEIEEGSYYFDIYNGNLYIEYDYE